MRGHSLTVKGMTVPGKANCVHAFFMSQNQHTMKQKKPKKLRKQLKELLKEIKSIYAQQMILTDRYNEANYCMGLAKEAIQDISSDIKASLEVRP